MCSNCKQNREHVEFVAEQMNTSERVRENYREQGRCQERQRIIKLLEDLAEKSENAEHWLFIYAVNLLKMEETKNESK